MNRAPRRPTRPIFIAWALCTLLARATTALAAPGDLDPTFDAGNAAAYGGMAVLTSAGRIVVGCAPDVGYGRRCATDAAVARLLPHGELDGTFGDHGFAFLPAGFRAGPVAVQSDDAIVVGTSSGNGVGFSLARLTPQGVLDATFGTGGTSTIATGYVRRLAVLPDDRIVALGCRPSSGDLTIARFLPDGTLDPTFSGDGMIVEDISGPSNQPSCKGVGLALQADGKVVVAGHASYGFGVLRYLPSGERDTSFGGTGLVLVLGQGPGNPNAVPRDAVIDEDGTILVGGHTEGAYGQLAFARLLPDGTPDPTFDHDGRLLFRLASAYWDRLGAFALEPGGRILVAALGTDAARLVRLERGGARDASFGDAGVLSLPTEQVSHTLLPESGAGRAVAVGPAGVLRVLLAGEPCPDRPGSTRRASLRVTTIGAFGGADSFELGVLLDLPAGLGFADVDPIRDGVRIVFEDAAGLRVDETLAAQKFARGSVGWRQSTGGKWVYRNDAEPRSGITRVVLKDRTQGARGLVRVKLAGRRSTYPVSTAPVTATIVFGGADESAAGLCGKRTFAADECTRPGVTLTCGD